MSTPTCVRCRCLIIQGASILWAEHGTLWRRWRAAGKTSRLCLCEDCTDDLIDFLRQHEADEVLEPMPLSA